MSPLADINYGLEIETPSNDTYLDAPALALTRADFTFSLWIHGNGQNAGGRSGGSSVISQNNGSAEHMIFGYESGGLSVRWKLGAGDTGIGGLVPFDDRPDPDLKGLSSWQHWAGFVRSDGSGGWERQLFMNGTAFTPVTSCAPYTGSGNLRFGQGSLGNSYLWFDNIILFAGRALSASEIEELYSKDEDWFRLDTSNFANLALLYRFHQQPNWPHFPSPGPYGYGVAGESSRYSPASATIRDMSGEGNDGVVSGARGVWHVRSSQDSNNQMKAGHGSGGKINRWGGVSVLGCLCRCGYAANGTAGPQPCTACDAGMYKPKWGTGSCQACQVGKYCHTSATCRPTAANSSSSSALPTTTVFSWTTTPVRTTTTTPAPTTSTAVSSTPSRTSDAPTTVQPGTTPTPVILNCLKGYTNGTGLNANICIRCKKNTYKGSLGPQACTKCPYKSYTDNAFVSMDVTACGCGHGYAGPNGGPCVQCAAVNSSRACIEFFNNDTSSGQACYECPGCPANHYLRADGVCLECHSNSQLPAIPPGSSDFTDNRRCKCNAGYYYRKRRCYECAAGSYKVSIGNTGHCSQCAAGKYSRQQGANSSSACLPCPPGTSSDRGSSECAPPDADLCNETAWPDKDHGLICGECKVLVDNLGDYGWVWLHSCSCSWL